MLLTSLLRILLKFCSFGNCVAARHQDDKPPKIQENRFEVPKFSHTKRHGNAVRRGYCFRWSRHIYLRTRFKRTRNRNLGTNNKTKMLPTNWKFDLAYCKPISVSYCIFLRSKVVLQLTFLFKNNPENHENRFKIMK